MRVGIGSTTAGIAGGREAGDGGADFVGVAEERSGAERNGGPGKIGGTVDR